MEPFPKRQRIYSPIDRSFPQSFDSEDVYYDDDDWIVDGEEEEEEAEDEEPAPDLDPESDFQQKRARLDYKLKSTFEAIFEKYGRDFDGVGDEIDLATGEIVVNNGHILDMLDERDAGDVERAPSVPTEATEESQDTPIEEVYDSDEEEEEESEETSEDELLDDAAILTGFARANRFSRPSPELGSLRKPPRPPVSHPKVHRPSAPPVKASSAGVPSRDEILARFGPQLGPQIARYVSKQSAPKERHIESVWDAPQIPAFKPRRQDGENIKSAWRAPDIPAFKPRRQEVKAPVNFPPEPERSPSPEEATSLWAVPGRRKRKNKPNLNNIAHNGGEGSSATGDRDDYTFGPTGVPVAKASFGQHAPTKRIRQNFTEEEDEILLHWVAFAKQKGMPLSRAWWQKLAEKHPNHSGNSWEQHYRYFSAHFLSNAIDGSEVSVSEPSIDSMHVAPHSTPAHRFKSPLNLNGQDTPRIRPNRIRKPAQKDSRIISWSQAVDAIESIDPEIHAGMMHNAGDLENINSSFDDVPTDFTQQISRPRNVPQATKPQTVISVSRSPPKVIIDLTDDVTDSAPRPELYSDDHFIPSVPCPHVECRRNSSALYRLQLRGNEELSEMSSHLFRVHRTTPYPCMEVGCSRLGEAGYFMAADLVRHVKKSHPSLNALYRLRGRVDSELLDNRAELFTPPSDAKDPSDRPVSQQRDSDFMSPRKLSAPRRCSSSQQRSYASDHTPRASTAALGIARSTPMTSVSSMQAHQSSTAHDSIEEQLEESVEDGNLRYIKYIDDMSMRGQRSSRGVSDRGGPSRPQMSAQNVLSSLKGKEVSSGSSLLPIPKTTTGSLSDSRVSSIQNTTREEEPTTIRHQQYVRSLPTSDIRDFEPTIAETPEPNSPQAQRILEPAAVPQGNVRSAPRTKVADVSRSMQRNVLDASYEFSDEEGEPETTHLTKNLHKPHVMMQPRVEIPFMPPPPILPTARVQITPVKTYSRKRVSKSKPRPSLATPAARKAVQQSILRMALDAEDFDELSRDDVVLLSSQPRSKPLSAIRSTIKQEDLMNTPRPLTNTISRKRSFNAFRRASSPDELVVVNSSPSRRAVTFVQPEIKAEDEVSLPEHPPSHRTSMALGLPLSHTTPSSLHRNMAIRTSTPLLNLTPTHHPIPRNEISDSAAEEEPSSSPALPTRPPNRPRTKRQRTATESVSTSPAPLADLLTPTKKQLSNGDALKAEAEQVMVVVKTPGGTFRRCGEGGFSCRRSFCFRCAGGSRLSVEGLSKSF